MKIQTFEEFLNESSYHKEELKLNSIVLETFTYMEWYIAEMIDVMENPDVQECLMDLEDIGKYTNDEINPRIYFDERDSNVRTSTIKDVLTHIELIKRVDSFDLDDIEDAGTRIAFLTMNLILNSFDENEEIHVTTEFIRKHCIGTWYEDEPTIKINLSNVREFIEKGACKIIKDRYNNLKRSEFNFYYKILSPEKKKEYSKYNLLNKHKGAV